MKFTDDYVDAQGPFCWLGDRPHITCKLITTWGWAPEIQAAIANPWWNTLDEDQANIVGNSHNWPGGTLENLMQPPRRRPVVTHINVRSMPRQRRLNNA